jgi:hypothetical protein
LLNIETREKTREKTHRKNEERRKKIYKTLQCPRKLYGAYKSFIMCEKVSGRDGERRNHLKLSKN